MSKPRCAVIGASTDRQKFGNKSLRAHQMAGYEVYPINTSEKEVEGLPAFASIRDIPGGSLDRVTLYVPPRVGINLLEDIAAKGCAELWLNPGTESPELIAKAEQLGLNVVTGCSIVDLGISPAGL